MKLIFRYIIILLALGIILVSFIVVWRQSRPVLEPYNICEAKICNINRTVVLSGELMAKNEVMLKSQISGMINKLYVEEGDYVKRGTIIASIELQQDPGMIVAREGSVTEAEIVLEQQRQETERAHRLFDKGIITKQELNNQDFMLKRAEENLLTAKRTFEVASQGYSELSGQQNITEVRSSVEGYVLSLPYKEKEMVVGTSIGNPGSPIAKIGDIKNLIFKGMVDESQVAKLHEGQSIDLVIAAMPMDTIHSAISYISLDCQKINGIKQYEIKSSIDPVQVHQLHLRSGYSVNAYIGIEEVNNVVAIPEIAVSYENGKTFVYELVAQNNNQEFKKIEVVLGTSDGLMIEVKSGISAGAVLRYYK